MSQESEQLLLFLAQKGIVTDEQVNQAMAMERSGVDRPITKILVDLGVSETSLITALASAAGLEYVDLTEVQVDPLAVSSIPESMCRRLHCFPFDYEGDALIVAMSDPGNVLAKDDLRAVTRCDIKVVLATETDIDEAINRFHRMEDSMGTLSGEVSEDSTLVETVDEIGDGGLVDEAPIVKLVNLIITQAVNDSASDIHIEPQERDVRIRFRIDGVLHEIMRSPKTIQAGAVSRLKIMADLDIALRRVPQSGRISVKVSNRPIDLRVETLPTVFGEKIVMRVIDKSGGVTSVEDLSFSDYNMRLFLRFIALPYGAMLVSGPTGSGKSTTLYAALNLLNKTETNVITVEDPVEQRYPGLNQVQVHAKAGMTFASALRSILRADPDVVMVGEMRDTETARIGVEAALTGHLVLSTIHTNDAPSVLTRLIDMGVEPFLVASAVDTVLGQRLARRLCRKCAQDYEASPEELREIGWPNVADLDRMPLLKRAIGCSTCAHTGYKGRIAVQEIMTLTEEIGRLCTNRVGSEDIKRVAIEQGMKTLRHDALEKAAIGLTSLEEVMRVTV